MCLRSTSYQDDVPLLNADTFSEQPLQERGPTISPPNSPQTSVSDNAEQRTEHPVPPAEIDIARLEELSTKHELAELLEQRKTIRTEEEKEKAWGEAAEMVKTYSDEMVEGWNKVIDTYLVFAGLFSAILTAFNVQSYPLLQPPTPDPVAVLQQISLQLHSFAIGSSFLNSTAPPAARPSSSNAAPGLSAVARSAIWLNILWFSGLILSLTSALLGILVKQWLNEYVSLGLTGNSREAARLRQYRLNNLVKWRVGDIVILIPVLLLISLGLFLAGLLVLLWTLHPTVALVASILVGVVAVFTIGAIFLPLFNNGCAYLSPQTFAFYSLWRHALYPVVRPVGYYMLSVPAYNLWLSTPFHFPKPFNVINHFLLAVSHLFPDTSETFPWNIHERHAVDSLSAMLDLDILNKAYECTLDVKAVSAAAVCLLDEGSISVIDYFTQLRKTVGKHSPRNGPKNELLFYQALLCALQLDTLELFSEDCRRVWRDNPLFLPSAGPHGLPRSTHLDSQASWLKTAGSWLEHRVLNPDTSKIPSPSSGMTLPGHRGHESLDELRSHCLILSGEGKMTAHEQEIFCGGQLQHLLSKGLLSSLILQTFFGTASDSRSRRGYGLLHLEAVMWFRFATCPLQLRYQKDRDARPLRIQAHLRYLRSTQEFFTYALYILSSSDLAEPPDHHVIRAQTFAVLSTLTEFLTYICYHRQGREEQRYLSHEHLDILSDIVNHLALGNLVLFPLIKCVPSTISSQMQNLHWQLKSLQRKNRFSGSQADITESLDKFKSATDDYNRRYRCWLDASSPQSRIASFEQPPRSSVSVSTTAPEHTRGSPPDPSMVALV